MGMGKLKRPKNFQEAFYKPPCTHPHARTPMSVNVVKFEPALNIVIEKRMVEYCAKCRRLFHTTGL